MNSSLVKASADAEDIELIGREFATKYFDALVGKPDSSALRRLYNDKSIHVFAQRGHPDHEMHGLCVIGWFMKRMGYSKCTVTVCTVSTTARAQHPAEYTVVAVCDLVRPGNDVPLKFGQTFVIKRVPWTRTEFQIVETRAEFDGEIEDDSLPKAVSIPIALMSSETVKASADLMSVGECDKGKLKNSCKKPTTIPTHPSSGADGVGKVVRRPATEKPADRNVESASTDISKRPTGIRTAIVRNRKVAQNPMPDIQCIVKNAPKVESKTAEIRTSAKKTFSIKKKKDKNASTESETPIEKKHFISTNRFEALVDDDEFESPLINSVVQYDPINHPEDNHGRSKMSKCITSTAKKHKTPKGPAAILSPKEQPIARKSTLKSNKPTTSVGTPKGSGRNSKKCEDNSAAVHLSISARSSAKRDVSMVRKDEMEIFVPTDKGSNAKKIDVSGALAETEMVHRYMPIKEEQPEHKEFPTDAVNIPTADEEVTLASDDTLTEDDSSEELVEPVNTEPNGSGVGFSYIRRIGRNYGRVVLTKVVYPLCYSIPLNPLKW